jgi:uncharacterized small protein (DUF1192 family)
MDWDEVRPKPKEGITVGANLELLSVVELEERIVALKSEIERVEAELTTKRARQQAAQSLFKQ